MFVDEVLVLDMPAAAAQDRLLAFHADGGVQDVATFAFREGHALLRERRLHRLDGSGGGAQRSGIPTR